VIGPCRCPPTCGFFAFISKFVEIPEDVVFTVENSGRAAQMAVYQLLGIDREIPPRAPLDRSFPIQCETQINAFKG